MLFELQLDEEDSDRLRPLPFKDLEDLDRLEEDLENILDNHLHDTLYQESPLMTFFRQRSFQKEADLYALNGNGDLVIFELKRGGAGAGAVKQILKYAQEAGRWSYTGLSDRYSKYTDKDRELKEAHQKVFGLDEPLDPNQFNCQQHLRVVGNAADTDLVEAVEYWKGQGLSISFVPYRIYEIEDSYYFEFFAKPNDQRINPANRKGVLFDTNKSYDENAVWDMMEKERVAAYGGAQDQADYLNRGDVVFYYHKCEGIIAAGKVVSETKRDGEDEQYHDVELLTPVPKRGEKLPSMSKAKIEDVTGESFFYHRTAKYPYLSNDQARDLLEMLRREIESSH
jgi:hypothetical protein